MLFILLAIFWYAIGVAGFAFWWSWDYGWQDFRGRNPIPSLRVNRIPVALLIGIVGPLAWPGGYFIHYRDDDGIPAKVRYRDIYE
jgi:hypothetical protein